MRVIARVGDKHICPRHGTNAIVEGGSGKIDGRAIARMGDKCACGGVIVEGDPNSTCDGRPVSYFGAKTSCGGIIAECTGSATLAG
ncbi:PAAR domain-containing protein [Paracoccus siganidrum]|uniref:PAAR domain-containing protein n=1 Tax=Paracoccus siganidrum TaxID=1276757 RepID=A0A419A3H2_9RHOB|nr:PAAR domain-containing protein [Paracoccus siganidrum]RJL07995.1 hypothetical protein D3P05_16820 [Paracoccus siganidrum]RMC38201.1 hypothetical protein C9E82_07055 [Paracoccus siganidrum]